MAQKPNQNLTPRLPGKRKESGLGISYPVRIRVNGRWREQNLSASMTLAYFLKEVMGLTGLKIACGQGACGSCTVLMDGKAVLSCMMLAVQAHGRDIQTIEGLPQDDPVVAAFAAQCEPGHGTALQCGYCTPGFVMTARALLNENPGPTMDEVREALSGNLCRCGCYAGIARAVLRASEKINGGDLHRPLQKSPLTPLSKRGAFPPFSKCPQ